MNNTKYIGISLAISLLCCVAIDGIGESFCWYLWYGSVPTSLLMNVAFLFMGITLASEDTKTGYAMATCIFSLLATQNYMDGNETVYFLHDFFSYGLLLIFTFILGWVAVLI